MNEHNKTINNEPHEEATVPERQLVSQESPKKRRKMMRDVPAKINQLRELAKEGCTREAICGILRWVVKSGHKFMPPRAFSPANTSGQMPLAKGNQALPDAVPDYKIFQYIP